MDAELAVQTRGLRKKYGDLTVLDGIDLQVDRGGVFALLGPNGAGKTTMVRILSTLVRPDGGHASVAGFDVLTHRSEVRRRISLTGQDTAVDDLQTGAENLRMMARLAGLDRAGAARRATELLELFELTDAGRRRVQTYSGGMRRRLDLAMGLVGQPGVIFLDEPTTGLDPRSRQATWGIVTTLARSGATVFLTTQYLDEADQLADRIVMLDAGRIVADGTPAALKQQYAQMRLDLTAVDPAAFAQVSTTVSEVGTSAERSVHSDRSRLVVGVATDGTATDVRHILDRVDPSRSLIERFTVHSATLDDVFLALTGRATVAPADVLGEKESVHV